MFDDLRGRVGEVFLEGPFCGREFDVVAVDQGVVSDGEREGIWWFVAWPQVRVDRAVHVGHAC